MQLLSEHPRAKPLWEYESQNRLAVHTTWLLNFEYVKKSPQGELASKFLEASAFFAPNEIQEELINCELLSTDKTSNTIDEKPNRRGFDQVFTLPEEKQQNSCIAPAGSGSNSQ